MAYYINLFSPETYGAFSASDRGVSGFRAQQQGTAASVRPGDKLICYMTKLSRWGGLLEVTSDYFLDDTPIFLPEADPFLVRFRVKPLAWLAPEKSVPIRDDACWEHLSFTRNFSRNSSLWTGTIRSSLRRLSDGDGRFLEELLLNQGAEQREFALSPLDRKKLQPSLVNSETGPIPVSIPDDEAPAPACSAEEVGHAQMQATVAEIGDRMRFKIWIPKADRQRVLEFWHPTSDSVLLERLPLNFNQVTLKIIENIDVLWIRRRVIFHAFEIEHTTSIYSGLLRMADLMALQPSLSISAHIVAPEARRAKVLQEISRPVFSLLESGPMSESCSYLSYDAVAALHGERNLRYLNDSVLNEYAEYAQDADF